MSVVALHPSTYWRRDSIVTVDSLGRVWVHGEIIDHVAHVQDTNRSEAERYDPSTDTWTTLAASPDYRYGTCWAMDPSTDHVVIAGGLRCALGGTPSNGGSARGFDYDPVADTWTRIPDCPPGPGANALNFLNAPHWHDDGLMHIAGGRAADNTTEDHTGATTQQSQVVRTYSGGSTGTWTIGTGVAGWGASSSLVYSAGGGSNRPTRQDVSGRQHFIRTANAAHYRYDPATDTFTAGALDLFGEVSCIDPAGQKIYRQARNIGDKFFGVYDIAANTFTFLANTPLAWGGAMVCDGTYVWAVDMRLGSPTNIVYAYNIATDTWVDSGDRVTQTRSIGEPIKDPFGPGYYLYGGDSTPGGSLSGSNVLEYWIPGFVAAATRRRGFAAVIG